MRAGHAFGRSGDLPRVAPTGTRQVGMGGAWAPPEGPRVKCAVKCGGYAAWPRATR